MHIAIIYTIAAVLATPLPQSNAALQHASNLRKELGPPQVSELAKMKKLVKSQKVEIDSLTNMVRQMEEKLDDAHLRIAEQRWEIARDDVPKFPPDGECILKPPEELQGVVVDVLHAIYVPVKNHHPSRLVSPRLL